METQAIFTKFLKSKYGKHLEGRCQISFKYLSSKDTSEWTLEFIVLKISVRSNVRSSVSQPSLSMDSQAELEGIKLKGITYLHITLSDCQRDNLKYVEWHLPPEEFVSWLKT